MSGNMWHTHFSEKLQKIGWKPLQTNPDLWMRKHHAGYKYLAMHTDDLIIASTETMKAMKKSRKATSSRTSEN